MDKPEAWELHRYKVVALRSHGPSGMTDRQGRISKTRGQVAGYAEVRFNTVGKHLSGFESNHAVSDRPAKKFNPSIEDEGLTAIIAARTVSSTMGRPGRELYSRRAKAIVQVVAVVSPEVTRPLGHTLEIVPLANPHLLASGEALCVRLLFHGWPLPNEDPPFATGANAKEAPHYDDDGCDG